MSKARTFSPVKTWLITGCIMITIMVMIGGITRLTDSGLSITEWNVIKGTIPPLNDAQWQEAFDKYKQIPEYQLRHAHFTLNDFKWIYFWEYIHRLWGRLMGFVFFIPFVIFWRKGYFDSTLKKRGIWILLGGGAVGSLGWFMVSSGLSENPDVSHYRLAIHLSAAFTLFCYVYWTYLIVKSRGVDLDPVNIYPSSTKKVLVLGVTLLGVQIIYGAFTAGLDAGTIYNTWPLMNGSLIPENIAPFNSAWTNYTDHKDGVQFIHRNLALIVAAVTLFLAYILKVQGISGKSWFWIAIVVLMQVILGIITLLDANSGDVSVFWGTLHQLGALLLLIQYLQVSFKIFAKPRIRNS